MREISFPGSSEDTEKVSRDYHEAARLEDTGDTFSGGRGRIFGYVKNGRRWMVATSENASHEFFEENQKIEGALDLIEQTVDLVYPTLVADFCASGLGCTEEELKKQYVSKEDILKRFILIADGQWVGEDDAQTENPAGRYNSRTHRLMIYLDHFLGEDGELQREYLVSSFIHELLHFVSKSRVNLQVTESLTGHQETIADPVAAQTGYYENDAQNGGLFYKFNEGVTELRAQELSQSVLKSLGKTYKTEEWYAARYIREREIIRNIIKYLAKHNGVSEQTVWDGWKSGYLTGGILNDPEVKRGLAECFGDDFRENFLAELGEKNSQYYLSEDERVPQPKWSEDPLESKKQIVEYGAAVAVKILGKRWRDNGGKK